MHTEWKKIDNYPDLEFQIESTDWDFVVDVRYIATKEYLTTQGGFGTIEEAEEWIKGVVLDDA